MELRHLQAFVAVAEELHFGRAAARLQLSASPVSRTVQELEKELRVPLFVRGHHHVGLTEAGAALLPEARELLRSWSAFTVHGRALGRESSRPRLRIGSPSLAPSELVDRIVGTLEQVHPEVVVEVEFATTRQLVDALRRQELDVTVALLPLSDDALNIVPLAQYQSGVVLSADDELAQRPSLTVADLAGRRVLMISSSVQPEAIDRVKAWLADSGAIVEEMGEPDLVRLAQLVRHGRGVTLTGTTGMVAQVFSQPGLTIVPLADVAQPFELGLVWRKDDDLHWLMESLAGRVAGPGASSVDTV